MKNINWNNLDEVNLKLKELSINRRVPKYTAMIGLFGRPFRRGIKQLGGYKHVVVQLGFKIANGYKTSDGHVVSSY